MTILKNLKENRGRVTLASVLMMSLILATSGLFVFVNEAKADALTSVRDILSTSAPSVVADHTIFFLATNGLANAETIILTTNFDGTPIPAALNFDDIDLSYDATPDGVCDGGDGAEMTLAAAPSGTTMGVVRTSATVLTFTNGSQTIGAGDEICIEIGLNAEEGGATAEQITNGSKDSVAAGTAKVWSMAISGTIGNNDTGTALVAIIEGVTVSVTVDASMSFTIAGVTDTSCTEGGSATQVTTTTGTVPYGTSGLTPNTFYKGCQDLTVSTNAANGYSISTEEDTSLLRTGPDSDDKTIDDAICDVAATCSSVIAAGTTTAWTDATSRQGFGYTCSGSACDAAFNSASEFNAFPCQSAVAASCDPVDGTLAKADPISASTSVSAQVSRIVYKLSFSGVQPPGAYSNTITYIATPTF